MLELNSLTNNEKAECAPLLKAAFYLKLAMVELEIAGLVNSAARGHVGNDKSENPHQQKLDRIDELHTSLQREINYFHRTIK